MSTSFHSALRRTFELAVAARAAGHHPFAAILLDSEGREILAATNAVGQDEDPTAHAELRLVQQAVLRWPAAARRHLTLVSSTEPSAMCAGAIYWAGFGRLVYGLSERRLAELTGADPANLTLRLPCRELFARGQRAIEVVGPLLEEEGERVHADFWHTTSP